jgi:hypothetical protein
MKNTILIALFSVFYNMRHTPPLNQACLRKIVPWLEFQPSLVHAQTKLGSKANQGGIFLNLTCFKGVLCRINTFVCISISKIYKNIFKTLNIK